jgi:hypothetical protein
MIVRTSLTAIVLGTLGCATLQPLREPAQFIAAQNPKVVYVTYKNRTVEGIVQPRVSGDSLYGALHNSPGHRVAVPLSQVQLVRALQPDKKRTTMLIAGLAVFAATSVYVLAKTGNDASCDSVANPDYLPGECEGR